MDKHFPSLKYLTIYYLGGIVFLLAEYLITRRLPSVEALVTFSVAPFIVSAYQWWLKHDNRQHPEKGRSHA